MNLVIKDAIRQILGRVASAIGGFLVIKLITPYLGPLRFGDYSTILKYFAIWSAFADFGIYVIALKQLGVIKSGLTKNKEDPKQHETLKLEYGKFVSTRAMMIGCVYTLALLVAYFIPAYTSNPYLVWGLPLGMLFSASFMTAGIVQIPLQLFWKMEQLSIGLIIARVAQIGVLLSVIFRFFPKTLTGDVLSKSAFMRIIGSVVISGVVQGAYVRWKGKDYLSLSWQRDRKFSKSLLRKNRQYGLAYYLSSFHTLIVLILISWFYPTSEGYTFVGVWALALGLVEILLIVPSALGNSLIHKVANETIESTRKRYTDLCFIVTWIGVLVVVLFSLFASHGIQFIGGKEFLATNTLRGSDTLLPRLAIILTLSFIKQVHNYLFVSTGHQNKLLSINLLGVTIGLVIGVPLILKYQLLGGLIAQGLLEVFFLVGALYVAKQESISLNLFSVRFACLLGVGLIGFGVQYWFAPFAYSVNSLFLWIIQGAVVTAILCTLFYFQLKKAARGL